jgi:integrase/recombinase XerD
MYASGGPFGTRSKRRVIPLSSRVQPLIEGHFALRDGMEMSVRTIQRVVRVLANRAQINRKVSPHVLRHTFRRIPVENRFMAVLPLHRLRFVRVKRLSVEDHY